jgi:hypothetical protein
MPSFSNERSLEFNCKIFRIPTASEPSGLQTFLSDQWDGPIRRDDLDRPQKQDVRSAPASASADSAGQSELFPHLPLHECQSARRGRSLTDVA